MWIQPQSTGTLTAGALGAWSYQADKEFWRSSYI